MTYPQVVRSIEQEFVKHGCTVICHGWVTSSTGRVWNIHVIEPTALHGPGSFSIDELKCYRPDGYLNHSSYERDVVRRVGLTAQGPTRTTPENIVAMVASAVS
jgi:hypothetical protein